MKKLVPAALALAVLSLQACDTTSRTETETTTTTTTETMATDTMPADTAVAGDMGTGHDSASHNMPANTAAISGTDLNAFIMEAADGGMAEVAHGQLMSQKASNPEVKKFAQQMVTDHTKANSELKTLANNKKVTLPTTMSKMHQEMQDRLSKMSGTELDKMYMEHMVHDHEKDVTMFKNASQSMPDADAKAFAAKTLPTLESHLQMARRVHGQLGGTSSTKP